MALVTGASSGIGRSISLLLAREGALVSIVDLNRAGGEQTVQEIREQGGEAIFVRANVARQIDARKAVKKTCGEIGVVGILVNCAGIVLRASVLETPESEWDRIMAVNLKSVFLFSRSVIPLMGMLGGGSIINIASGWGLTGGPQAAAYCASKGAVVQLTRAMAIDHGNQNIRVNCVCPGDTDTPMLLDEARQLGGDLQSFRYDAKGRPLGRIARPEDIASAAVFLACDESAFVTGTTLVVDGGGLAG